METICPHCTQTLELDAPTLEALAAATHFDCPACGGAVLVPADAPGPANDAVEAVCPHCSQAIALDASTLVALADSMHFDCPTCGGAVPVPSESEPSAPLLAAAKAAPVDEVPPPEKANVITALLRTFRGLNRNVLILGAAAVLILGGLGIYLATRKGANTHSTKRDVKNEVINNKFFSDLVASGATNADALDTVTAIQPIGITFVGVSKEKLTWEQAQQLAKRTASRILTLDPPGTASRRPVLESVAAAYPDLADSTVWAMDNGEPKVITGVDINRVTTLDRPRKAFVFWLANRKAESARHTLLVLSPIGPLSRTYKVGEWLKIALDYHNPGPNAARIWAMPYTKGRLSAGAAYASSEPYSPGKGRVERALTCNSPSTADELRIHMADSETKEIVAIAIQPLSAVWEIDKNTTDIELISVGPPATLSPSKEIGIPAARGTKFKVDLKVRYKTPQPTKLASNLLLKDANFLPPEFLAELAANHSATWHFDTDSRPGYKAVQGEGELSFDLTGYAPKENGQYSFNLNLGLFDRQTWNTLVLKLHKVSLTVSGRSAGAATGSPANAPTPLNAAAAIVEKPDAPYGLPVAGRPGFVKSPFAPAGVIDVRGLPKGTEIKDPYSGKVFLIP